VLVEGDEWAHAEALDPDAGCWPRRFAQLVTSRAGRESRDRAVVASAAELVEQLKEIARLRAEGALTESELEQSISAYTGASRRGCEALAAERRLASNELSENHRSSQKRLKGLAPSTFCMANGYTR